MGAVIEPCNASRSQQWNREHCRDAFYNDGLTHANHQKLAALCTKNIKYKNRKHTNIVCSSQDFHCSSLWTALQVFHLTFGAKSTTSRNDKRQAQTLD